VTSSVAKECYFSITVQINLYRLEKKSVMDRRGNMYTEVPEDLVTGCCMKKGKRGSQQRRLIISLTNYLTKVMKSGFEI
jgi:hypothetical protein